MDAVSNAVNGTQLGRLGFATADGLGSPVAGRKLRDLGVRRLRKTGRLGRTGGVMLFCDVEVDSLGGG